jgi:hypothetical protein
LFSVAPVSSLRFVTSRRVNPPGSPTRHPIGTPRGLSTNTGPIASAAWLAARELYPRDPKWRVEIELAVSTEQPTRFELEIYAEEWGYRFSAGERMSWIRVTDVPFIHGRDDHSLLRSTPSLREIGALLRELEDKHAIAFDRDNAVVRTTIDGGEAAIRTWLETL